MTRTLEETGQDTIDATEAVERVIGAANAEIDKLQTEGAIRMFKSNLICSFLGTI